MPISSSVATDVPSGATEFAHLGPTRETLSNAGRWDASDWRSQLTLTFLRASATPDMSTSIAHVESHTARQGCDSNDTVPGRGSGLTPEVGAQLTGHQPCKILRTCFQDSCSSGGSTP